MNNIEILILLIPIISGMLFSRVCRINREDTDNIDIIPPGWIFAIIWPILYILLGYTWVHLRRLTKKTTIDIMFSVLVLLLLAWMWLYNCMDRKILAFYTLVITPGVVLAMILYTFNISPTLSLTLIPLYIWLTIARYFNYTVITS